MVRYLHMRVERLPKVLCPKCKQFGFLTYRWVPRNYYPEFVSGDIMMMKYTEAELAKDPNNLALKARLERFKRKVVGSVYRGEPNKDLYQPYDAENISDKKSHYRVTYGKYEYLYIGHYDKEKYKGQMIKFRAGELKSRPNGRRWCKPSRYFHLYRVVDSPNGKYIKFVRSSYPNSGRSIYP